jgi:ABC-2 type transport system ATP-binding protein
VDDFTTHRQVLSRQRIGSMASVTVSGPLDDLAQARAREMNLQVEPVSLQEFVVRTAGQSARTEDTERISA